MSQLLISRAVRISMSLKISNWSRVKTSSVKDSLIPIFLLDYTDAK